MDDISGPEPLQRKWRADEAQAGGRKLMRLRVYSRLGTRLRDMLHSLWFLPSLMVVLAVLLAVLTIRIDGMLRHSGPPRLLLFPGGVEGARSLLGGIASSLFGVAGTVFTITITALSIASAQMGPRLMESFTRDWRNSVSLGTFLGTVAYTFTILRSVPSDSSQTDFIPHLGVYLALLFTFISVIVLIYFIHHVATSINVGYVISSVHDDLCRTLLTQTVQGQRHDQPHLLPPEWKEQDIVYAPRSGYLQSVDTDALVHLAVSHGVTVCLLVRAGDFIMKDVPVAWVTPQACKGIPRTLTIGKTRTTNQDIEYAARKLVEVASRALSPAMNDPYTAMTVLDHLGDALVSLQNRGLINGQFEREGQVRLIMPQPEFSGLVETMFNMIRQYGRTHPSVMIRMLEVLTRSAAALVDPDRRSVLQTHADLVYKEALEHTEAQHDRDALERRYQRFVSVCNDARRLLDPGRPLPVQIHE
ncbi:DUF2254 domain-containing protein [Deinococcus deserti]